MGWLKCTRLQRYLNCESLLAVLTSVKGQVRSRDLEFSKVV